MQQKSRQKLPLRLTSGDANAGLSSHPLKGNARLQNPTVAPVENRECPVLMLEAGGPLLGLNYSLA